MPKALNFATFFSTYLTQDVPENYHGEYRLDCPLHSCENPLEHFYANCDDGTWHCKRCDSAGNAKTLITMLHQQHYELTTYQQYLSLSELRGISPETFENAGFAYDADNDRWLVPYYTYNPDTGEWSEFLNNLGYFYPSSTNESTRFKIKKAGALSLYLYNPGIHSCPPSDTAIICEGEWDTLAYYELHPDTTDLVLGKPGSGFNIAYMKTLAKSKTVHLLLDNDPAGHKQTVKAIEVIKNDISDIKILDWSLMEHAQKDVRDLWMMEGKKSHKLISESLIPADFEAVDKEVIKLYQTTLSDYETVETFDDYTKTLATYLYMTPETLAAMAAVLGITNSITIPGEPLWAFLIGPPSCLDGNTVVKINRAGKTFDITMRELHYMSNGGWRGGKQWNRGITTKIQRRDSNGTIRLVPVLQVVGSGYKECYEVTTESGHKIVASKDHKFLTSDGWKRLETLTLSDNLFVNNGNRGVPKEINKNSKTQFYKVDGNHTNNKLENLELTNVVDHGVIHGQENVSNVAERTDISKIVSIVEVGERHTYDLTVASDPHNFLANGIVVHNSGKTTFIDSFGGNNELFDNLSKISAKSLVSGWKDETGDEPSYLAKLKDKTLFVKDFTVTLTDSIDSQKEVFGLLTDIFDGYVKIPYGNNQVREFYDLYFNMVAGVTDIVHSHSAASIGERFLRIDYLGKNYDSRMFARRALQNFGQARPQKELLTKNTLGFVNHLRSMPMIMTLQDEYLDPITDLAEFIATIRTKVESDPKEGVKYTPRPELPSRLANQLAKLFVSTRGVYNLDPNSDEQIDISSRTAFETVKKVALDTCYGFSLDIVRTIKKYPMLDRQNLAEVAKIHPQRAYRVLTDLCTTGVLTKVAGRVGASGGRPAHYYAINPKLANVLDYDCQESPKPSKPKHPINRPRRKG
jgi:5S rRNA maturation endonuclease (ribonuclease M5)